MSTLPEDPVNQELGPNGNFLGDGPPTDQGYVYQAFNSGQGYVLGTNFELPANRNQPGNYNCGNYQILVNAPAC